MAASNHTAADTTANQLIDSSPLSTDAAPLSNLLSELSIQGNSLLFGLNFKYTEVTKKGFINRLKKNKETMDIDLSCVIFDDKLQVVDTVWFKQLRDESSAVRHQGDSLDGKDRGATAELDRNVDVETIEIRLPRLAQNAEHIALLVSSYKGHPLNKIERGNIYISDDEGNEIYASDLTLLGIDSSALCVAVLSRELGEWRFTVKDLPLTGTDMDDMAKQVSKDLARIYA